MFGVESILGIRLDYSKDFLVLKVVRRWGRLFREIVVRNIIC